MVLLEEAPRFELGTYRIKACYSTVELYLCLAATVGYDPTSSRLTAESIAGYATWHCVEILLGFEPRPTGWKPVMLPLNTTESNLVADTGIEPV